MAAPTLIGRSPALAALLREIAVISSSSLSVLLLGPSGVGKSEVAKVIHANSPRREGPLVVVDCARLRAERAEADLFGAVRGAYTGLDRPRDGLVAAAQGGTLFLDEVGELPAEVQCQLLVFLQTRTWRPMGSEQEKTANVRVVSATSRDVRQLSEALYFRLSGMVIEVPSLAERMSDLPALAAALLERAAAADGLPVLPLSRASLQELGRREWPGNVRELQQAVTRGLLYALHDRSPDIRPPHLGPAPARSTPATPDVPDNLELAERRFRRSHCERVVTQCAGNKTTAAERLGISRSTLYEVLGSPSCPEPRTRPSVTADAAY